MSSCPICLSPLWADDDAWCPYCGQPMDEGGIRNFDRGPYDDEGDLAYSDVACGEDAAPPVPPALDNPAYPPRRP